jgi:hypothetical protein
MDIDQMKVEDRSEDHQISSYHYTPRQKIRKRNYLVEEQFFQFVAKMELKIPIIS